uniref:Uncharacterized protein n=1 Tax=viral metagenome TaxID=1070528 RepID=A0A6C0BV54_9ZZZZ
MFKDINLSDYIIQFELQKAYFLRDCLYEEITYELKDTNIIIYKKSDNGITEEMTLDELIFYIHTEVADEIIEYVKGPHTNGYGHQIRPPKSSETVFMDLFKDIDNIKRAVENMKIILKYDMEDEAEIKNNTNEDDQTLAF